jgi:magnesium chelatase family protein
MPGMHALVRSAALTGVDAIEVVVEASIAGGLPGVYVVGLPDAAVREARERVRAALRSVRLALPASRVVVNLAPADVRKEGPAFDLPIALALLAAQSRLPHARLRGATVVGELGLDGCVRTVRGILALALAARDAGSTSIVFPALQAPELMGVAGLDPVPVASLAEAIAWARGATAPQPDTAPRAQSGGASRASLEHSGAAARPSGSAALDLRDVRGQLVAKRALEVAAAGRHHLLLVGPPGGGKTMLARRLPGLLPPLSSDEAMAVARLHSLAGVARSPLERLPPLREPHHTVSLPGLLGSPAALGELSLAHHGVLFLDELPEFDRRALEALREPLERGSLLLARARSRQRLPAEVVLVGSMNPCPCGHEGDPRRACSCLPSDRRRYLGRLSGPLLDRLALRVTVPACAGDDGRSRDPGESSGSVAARVAAARALALERQGCANAALGGATLARYASVPRPARVLLEAARSDGRLSERGLDDVRRVARTLADLVPRDAVGLEDVAEALGYRAELARHGA